MKCVRCCCQSSVSLPSENSVLTVYYRWLSKIRQYPVGVNNKSIIFYELTFMYVACSYYSVVHLYINILCSSTHTNDVKIINVTKTTCSTLQMSH